MSSTSSPTAVNLIRNEVAPFRIDRLNCMAVSLGIWTLILHWVHMHCYFTAAFIKHTTFRFKIQVCLVLY